MMMMMTLVMLIMMTTMMTTMMHKSAVHSGMNPQLMSNENLQ